MNKKASLEKLSEVIVHLVLILLVLVMLLGAVIKIKDNKSHNLKVESINYALFRDVISATDHNLNYDYQLKEKINLEIDKEKCLIKSRYKEDITTPNVVLCNKNELKNIQETKQNNIIRIKNE